MSFKTLDKTEMVKEGLKLYGKVLSRTKHYGTKRDEPNLLRQNIYVFCLMF